MSHGWNTTVTKASGDQGADVVADKSGVRIVLQCKLYSGPVGNKAVQEAFTAQRHYAVHRSAVVTNAEFTKSARELASTTGVLLLHYSDLTRLDELLSQQA
jgi:restriction system protein